MALARIERGCAGCVREPDDVSVGQQRTADSGRLCLYSAGDRRAVCELQAGRELRPLSTITM